jgi:hypothetical protein
MDIMEATHKRLRVIGSLVTLEALTIVKLGVLLDFVQARIMTEVLMVVVCLVYEDDV